MDVLFLLQNENIIFLRLQTVNLLEVFLDVIINHIGTEPIMVNGRIYLTTYFEVFQVHFIVSARKLRF
jgi:hypothetical protein